MAARFPLDETFCVSFFWLALFSGGGMLLIHPILRRTQKYHSVLTNLEKNLKSPLNSDSSVNSPRNLHRRRTNFYKDEELEQVLHELPSAGLVPHNLYSKMKEIHERGLSNLRFILHETSIFPAAIIDIILLYSYDSKKIYRPIVQQAMFEMVLYRFRNYSRCIEWYCFIRMIMVSMSFGVLVHQYAIWHHKHHWKHSFLYRVMVYLYVMLYHPIYKGTIIRIWNAYNVSALYLPVMVQMALRVEMCLFLLIGIVHGIFLFVAMNVFGPYTLLVALYYVLQRRYGTKCINTSKVQNMPWYIREPVYFVNMYTLWFIIVLSLWIYTMALPPFLSGHMYWSQSFAYGVTGDHCKNGLTVDVNDWGLVLVLVTWAIF